MSISSPTTDYQVECYRSKVDDRIWWYYTWKQNGRRRDSLSSFTTRDAAKTAMVEHRRMYS